MFSLWGSPNTLLNIQLSCRWFKTPWGSYDRVILLDISPSPRVSDPAIHHGDARAGMHGGIAKYNEQIPLESVARKTFPAIPQHAQPAILRIWLEAHWNGSWMLLHYSHNIKEYLNQFCGLLSKFKCKAVFNDVLDWPAVPLFLEIQTWYRFDSTQSDNILSNCFIFNRVYWYKDHYDYIVGYLKV